MWKVLVRSFLVLQLSPFVSAQGRNVAVNQNASQLQTLEFSDFLWTADKAVDNCTSQDDPDNQQCCSCSLGTTTNFWRVDFDQAYNISSVVVIGRDSTASSQTKDFQVVIVSDTGMEEQIYDNACCEYGDGIFTIPVPNKMVSAVVVTRPTESLLTLCEVQVFEVESISDTVSTVTPTVTNVSSVTGNTTDSNPGQNTTMSQVQTTNANQNQTTGEPSSATRADKRSEITLLFFLNVIYVWKYM